MDLRRAASTAYYAVFHCLCGAAAETLVPAGAAGARSLVYRALEHGRARERCRELTRSPLKAELETLFTRNKFAQPLRDFARAFQELQELRHSCDYDPAYKASKADIEQAVRTAEQAINDLREAGQDERRDFLVYLLFGLR